MNNIQNTQDTWKKVTPREIEIIRAISDGKSTKEIADALGITVNTVEVHRHAIIKKTGCRNSVHVVATFLRTAVMA